MSKKSRKKKQVENTALNKDGTMQIPDNVSFNSGSNDVNIKDGRAGAQGSALKGPRMEFDIDNTFVRADVLEALTKGSKEDFISSVNQLIQDNKDMFFNGEPEEVQIVATFDDRVFVATSDANLFKVGIGGPEGSLEITYVKMFTEPLMSKSQAKDYAEQKIESLVDTYLRTKNIDPDDLSQVMSMRHLFDVNSEQGGMTIESTGNSSGQ